MASIKQKIVPMLWFDTQAEEAAAFYVSVFEDAEVLRVSRYGEGAQMPSGTALTVEFTLAGQRFTALNGGPVFTFTEAVSFVVDCSTQEEVDHYWDLLGEGGPVEAQQCGWLKDRFGLSWQIVPKQLGELMSDPDPVKSQRTMAAMLQMTKLDIAELQRAHDGT
ncbi:MAG: VOC family protein [Coriobacteriia bacterium]|nr:VOC family protein [Coriobacteriia bacterium]